MLGVAHGDEMCPSRKNPLVEFYSGRAERGLALRELAPSSPSFTERWLSETIWNPDTVVGC